MLPVLAGNIQKKRKHDTHCTDLIESLKDTRTLLSRTSIRYDRPESARVATNCSVAFATDRFPVQVASPKH